MIKLEINLEGLDFQALRGAEGLAKLDAHFLGYLRQSNAKLHQQLLGYRRETVALTPAEIGDLLLTCSPILEDFVANMFGIVSEVERLRAQTILHDPIFQFKEYYVQKHARRRISKKTEADTFEDLDKWLSQHVLGSDDRELAVAIWGVGLLEDEKANAPSIDKLIDWCLAVLTEPEGRRSVESWVMFKLPQKLDYERLVPAEMAASSEIGALSSSQNAQRQRDGFHLTDHRMSARDVQNEIHYCVYCHDKEGDFCSKGFPVKKKEPELGLKKNPLDEFQTGCPVEEKISEMHLLKRHGYSVGALAMVMVDNPMCAVTGHRICNDCMKACIFQKQDPVDIPQAETRVLTDVLDLPWGVEIYDLFARWNPLRQKQWMAKPYNGLKVMVMGMGPAGFSLAHHLLMEGFAVVGVDGLKIEPLPPELYNHPICDFKSIKEPNHNRIMTGFGGVMEYGITARWDKNFLKLIYIMLMRREYFSLYGGVRLGGTVTVEDAWELGFDHLALAVGAGLPRELHIPGSMAPGMRQANDFLMALQLTGAAKENSLANLQLRLPVVVIGGGLTGIDTATEAQAYYIKQVEKTLVRYEKLVDVSGEAEVAKHFPETELDILNEFLDHGRQVREERVLAKNENRPPDFISLIHNWGGVTIIYRRKMNESPAYKRNHDEINKALEEGVFYAENLEPVEAKLDQHGHVAALICVSKKTGEQVSIAARAVLVATGAKPNIAYEFEHHGTFAREAMDYKAYDDVDGELTIIHPDGHVKTKAFGAFTSYQEGEYRVSFLGDTHPVFHGSVVKAIASAKRIYPKIVESFDDRAQQVGNKNEYARFAQKIDDLFLAQIDKVTRRTDDVLELTIKAPMAAKNFKPGQFYRVQNFEILAPIVKGTRLASEAVAVLGMDVDKENGLICLIIMEEGVSSRLFATFKSGDPISIMGPTGVRTKIPKDNETILIMGEGYSVPFIRSVGPALREAGNHVIYIAGFTTNDELYCQDELEAAADVIVWATKDGSSIEVRREKDYFTTGNVIDAVASYAASEQAIQLSDVDRVMVVGRSELVKQTQQARGPILDQYLTKNPQFIGSVYGPMQCMLKGVCAQCLQWQIDPETGKRTKAVYACSWQDQPMEIIDMGNLDDRLAQNRCQEILTGLWLDRLV